MALPAPTADQAFCTVSALDGGSLEAADDLFIADGIPGKTEVLPALCFLIQHSQRPQKFLFDLGINSDLGKYPPVIQRRIGGPTAVFKVFNTTDCVQSLAKGGTSPDDIDFVCISHCHWDHTGDTHAFKKSTFLVGDGCRSLFVRPYPEDPDSRFAFDLLPADHTQYLPVAEWKPVGPFPRAFDFYGDGSLFIVDSPGHLVGHVNILARTSPDGGWIYLAGDSAHHWKLLTGESEIKVGMPYGLHFCMHEDKEKAYWAHTRTAKGASRAHLAGARCAMVQG
ncbi:beta-lactamase-like protein [Flammula alnicola]|nr:beta-lactamase-like protein [Flammula alnicola]